MSQRKYTLFCALVALGALGVTGAIAKQATPPTGVKKEGKKPKPPKDQNIRVAFKALQDAEAALKAAKGEFGGHRTTARHFVEQALDEVRAAIKRDKD